MIHIKIYSETTVHQGAILEPMTMGIANYVLTLLNMLALDVQIVVIVRTAIIIFTLFQVLGHVFPALQTVLNAQVAQIVEHANQDM